MKGIKDAQRIVVKVGTSTLTYDTGKVNLRRMDKLAQVISDLRNSGIEVALVTSAALESSDFPQDPRISRAARRSQRSVSAN